MTANAAFEQDLELRRIDQLFRQSATAPVACNIGVLLFLWLGWNVVPHAFLIPWAIAWEVSLALRVWMAMNWRSAKDAGCINSLEKLNRWNSGLVIGCCSAGLFIGLMGLGSSLYLPAQDQLYVGLLILGMCSSSIAVYSASLVTCLGVLLLATLLWTAGLAYEGEWPLVFMLVVYVLIHLRLAKNWNAHGGDLQRITLELHHNRERLRLAMDSSGASSWSWNTRSGGFICDENIVHVLGLENSAIVHIQNYLDQVLREDLDKVALAFSNALVTGTLDLEHRLNSPRGTEPRFVALRGRIQGESGLSGIVWDITAQKNDERVLFERNLFEKANHAKVMFLANVSHEIRTPLTAINGFAESILNDRDLPGRFREPIGIVLRSGKYLTSVVHDLLDLSKAEAQNLYIQHSKVNLPLEINDSIHVVRSAIEKKQLKLSVDYATPVPEIIVSDATRLRQILINLLSNSVKYTERGRIDVRVSFEEKEVSGRLRIVVSDTGIGISDCDKRNLFQPFTRGESAQVRQRQGSGLGLVLSRSLAMRMGGDLRLLSTVPRSASGEGSTVFELTIEVGTCNESRHLRRHPYSHASGSGSPGPRSKISFENRRILLVEDDEDIRWLLQDYLQKNGASVTTCAHGGEAVKAAFESHFDAVLMDINMPVMNGCEATTALRDKGCRYPIIALTAHANHSDMKMCYEAGCDFYLSKPIDFGHLRDVLNKCLTVPVLTTS